MEHRDQHVAARDFLASRRLHVQRRALKRALHSDRVARRDFLALGHPLDLLVEVMRELAPQRVEVGAATLQNGGRRHVMQHREQQMLEAYELVTPVNGFGHRELQRYLHSRLIIMLLLDGGIAAMASYSFSITHLSGYSACRASSSTVCVLVSATSNGYTPATPIPF